MQACGHAGMRGPVSRTLRPIHTGYTCSTAARASLPLPLSPRSCRWRGRFGCTHHPPHERASNASNCVGPAQGCFLTGTRHQFERGGGEADSSFGPVSVRPVQERKRAPRNSALSRSCGFQRQVMADRWRMARSRRVRPRSVPESRARQRSAPVVPCSTPRSAPM
jgi:hypothetical protein